MVTSKPSVPVCCMVIESSFVSYIYIYRYDYIYVYIYTYIYIYIYYIYLSYILSKVSDLPWRNPTLQHGVALSAAHTAVPQAVSPSLSTPRCLRSRATETGGRTRWLQRMVVNYEEFPQKKWVGISIN